MFLTTLFIYNYLKSTLPVFSRLENMRLPHLKKTVRYFCDDI